MRTAILTRNETSDEGTFGTLITDKSFRCRTGELPWRLNSPNSSCIPQGIYRVTFRFSPKFGMCYHLEGVPSRSDILIHAANFMGDKSLGWKSELLGCIAPGSVVGILNGQKAVLSSRSSLMALQENLGQETFELTITSV